MGALSPQIACSLPANFFFPQLYDVRHISWDRGGAFFHELFEFYKAHPKLQVEFLVQTLMQIKGNPSEW